MFFGFFLEEDQLLRLRSDGRQSRAVACVPPQQSPLHLLGRGGDTQDQHQPDKEAQAEALQGLVLLANCMLFQPLPVPVSCNSLGKTYELGH